MNRQLTLPIENTEPNSVIESAEFSITNSVIETPNEHIIKFLNSGIQSKGKGHVNEYPSTTNKNYYYRFSYRLGNRIKHAHIPGGNVGSSSATRRADIIQQMVDRDAPTSEILEMIKAFGKT